MHELWSLELSTRTCTPRIGQTVTPAVSGVWPWDHQADADQVLTRKIQTRVFFWLVLYGLLVELHGR